MPETTIATTPTDFALLEERLRAQGWLPGPPRQARPGTTEVDAEIAHLATCPRCRREGLTYHPFHCGPHYTAVMACPSCEWASEF